MKTCFNQITVLNCRMDSSICFISFLGATENKRVKTIIMIKYFAVTEKNHFQKAFNDQKNDKHYMGKKRYKYSD